DSEASREALRALLRRRGFEDVLSAASGEEALHLLGVDAPPAGLPPVEVVLMDVDMPGLDGIEPCRRLQADENVRDVPLLLVYANTSEGALEAGLAAGACDCLTKPVQPGELLARLRSALALKHQLDECRSRERQLVELTGQLRRLNQELRRLAII